MRQITLFLLMQAMFCNVFFAQEYSEINLWPDGPSDNKNVVGKEKKIDLSEAKLYIYRPDKKNNTRMAVVICPGGGYAGLAMQHEGHDYAKWLIENGITAIILKYRLPDKKHYIPLQDAQRAIRFARTSAEELDIDPQKIGIAGFSAGGHLASTAGTRFDNGNSSTTDPVERVSCRPDFMILFYPVITMKEEFAHMGSRYNLIGEGYKAELVKLYSNEEQVTMQTPPVFLITSDDDKVVLPRNSVEFYSSLKRHNIPAVLYIIPDGGHGWGTHLSKSQYSEWSVPLKAWMEKVIMK